jgi:hypothetical protein
MTFTQPLAGKKKVWVGIWGLDGRKIGVFWCSFLVFEHPNVI